MYKPLIIAQDDLANDCSGFLFDGEKILLSETLSYNIL